MSPYIKKISLVSILLAALYVFVILFVIFPTLSGISENKSALAKRQDELDSLQNKIEVLRKTDQNKDNTNEISGKVSALWPDDKAVSNFIVSLDDLAKGEILTFDNVSMSEQAAQAKSEGAAKSAGHGIQFSFSTNGSYSQILNVVSKLEKFDRFNIVKNITLNVKEGGMIAMSLTGNIFYGK